MERRPSICIHTLQRIGNLFFFTINLSCNNNYVQSYISSPLWKWPLKVLGVPSPTFVSFFRAQSFLTLYALGKRPGWALQATPSKMSSFIQCMSPINSLTKFGTYSQNLLWNNFLPPLLTWVFISISTSCNHLTTKITSPPLSRIPFTSILLEPFVYSMGRREGNGVFHSE